MSTSDDDIILQMIFRKERAQAHSLRMPAYTCYFFYALNAPAILLREVLQLDATLFIVKTIERG